MKMSLENRAQKVIKTTLQKLIKNISVIAIFVALVIIGMAYAGLTFNIPTEIIISVAVPSIILSIACVILYELWSKSGIDEARLEDSYMALELAYKQASNCLNLDNMQKFLDSEKKRRYNVKYTMLTDNITKTENIIKTLTSKNEVKPSRGARLRLRLNKRHLKRLITTRDTLSISLPYDYSEQFDQLRNSTKDVDVKEYKPNAAKVFVKSKRIKKYTFTIITTVIGFNLFTPTIGLSTNWYVALFMTCLAAVSLVISVVSGFNVGYASISITMCGVYNTALSFIQKAKAYCDKQNIQLYDAPSTEYIDNTIIEETEETKETEDSADNNTVSTLDNNIVDNVTANKNVEIKADTPISETDPINIFNNLLKM